MSNVADRQYNVIQYIETGYIYMVLTKISQTKTKI